MQMRCVTTTSCSTLIPKNQGENFYSFMPNTFFTIFYSFKSNTFFTTFCRYKSIVLITFKSKLVTFHLAERDGFYRIHIVFQFQLSHQVGFFKTLTLFCRLSLLMIHLCFVLFVALKIFFSVKLNNIFLRLTY